MNTQWPPWGHSSRQILIMRDRLSLGFGVKCKKDGVLEWAWHPRSFAPDPSLAAVKRDRSEEKGDHEEALKAWREGHKARRLRTPHKLPCLRCAQHSVVLLGQVLRKLKVPHTHIEEKEALDEVPLHPLPEQAQFSTLVTLVPFCI